MDLTTKIADTVTRIQRGYWNTGQENAIRQVRDFVRSYEVGSEQRRFWLEVLFQLEAA